MNHCTKTNYKQQKLLSMKTIVSISRSWHVRCRKLNQKKQEMWNMLHLPCSLENWDDKMLSARSKK